MNNVTSILLNANKKLFFSFINTDALIQINRLNELIIFDEK
jgi:hypothetical protein